MLSLTGIAQARGLRIRLRYEHLAAEIDEEPEPWEPDAEELEGLEARIRAAVVEMRDEHDFSGVADAQVCGWCRYRSICRDSAAPGEAQWPEILPDEPAPVEALDTAAT